MGTVFLALDRKLQRQVAIKFVALQGRAAVRRFIDEARVTARCTHPNIVVIHEISEDAGTPYMVLEYVKGESLLHKLQRAAIAPACAVDIALQTARALAFAHARGIVHRDLKPANILIGDDNTVKIVDFGIAKSIGLDDAPLGAEGAMAGAGGDVTVT